MERVLFNRSSDGARIARPMALAGLGLRFVGRRLDAGVYSAQEYKGYFGLGV